MGWVESVDERNAQSPVTVDIVPKTDCSVGVVITYKSFVSKIIFKWEGKKNESCVCNCRFFLNKTNNTISSSKQSYILSYTYFSHILNPKTTSLNKNMLMFQMNGKLEIQEPRRNSCNVSKVLYNEWKYKIYL